MSQFSAQEPSLGYHYQIRYALYLLLKSRDREDPFIKLEVLDDVEIGDINSTDLFQTKFHNKKAADLTDSSVDIWKTIRVWSEMITKNQLDLNNVVFVLVTTSKVSESSILNQLTENGDKFKTIMQIVDKLDEVTKKSQNQNLTKSFVAYNLLSNEQKEKLIKNIKIYDSALSFEELKTEIQKELRLTCLPEQIDGVFENLQGWWYEQCILHLQGVKDMIYFDETRKYIVHLNDKFKFDNLPVDKTIKLLEIEDNIFDTRVFVNQLLEIGIGAKTLRRAKRDLYRAEEQRSKWIREELLHPQEEIDYESNLKDDWDRRFAPLQDDSEDKNEDELKEICKSFYINFYVNSHPPVFIRPRVREPFIITGSCHMMADKQEIVWHPKFLKNR